MKKTFIVLLLIGLMAVGLVSYGVMQTVSVAPTVAKAEGYFSDFGTNESLADNLVEKNPVVFNDEQTAEGNATSTYSLNKVVNESFTGNSASYVNLANDDFEPGSETVRNATDGSIVSSSEYTMNYTDGGIKVGSTWDTSSMTITYNWMDKKQGTRIAKVYFEIDGKTNGGTLEFDWANTNVTSENTIITEAEINNEEHNLVQDLSESDLQDGREVSVQPLRDGEYVLYFELDHTNFLPNRNSGTYEKGLDIDFTLNSDAEDEPVEVKDYTIFAKTIAP